MPWDGTYLGDPIEVAALTSAFREHEATGSPTGLGPRPISAIATPAAGVASLIKASLALHHWQIPPSLGYEAPGTRRLISEGSPFWVNTPRWSPAAA